MLNVQFCSYLNHLKTNTYFLEQQIDAAINSGNSGGPAFSDKGKCVGIAFQSLKHEDVENIGYVIPTPVILHFIGDYEKTGGYTGTNKEHYFLKTICLLSFHLTGFPIPAGFPIIGIEWQKMENPDLRKAMGMKADQKGVRIRRVEPTAPESHLLQPSDILLSFDRIDIANDGTSKTYDLLSMMLCICNLDLLSFISFIGWFICTTPWQPYSSRKAAKSMRRDAE